MTYLTMKGFNKRPRTFTITWTEKEDMSSGWTYSDSASWLTAWDPKFDDFFWYSAVRLNWSWQETATIEQSTPWVLDITQLGTLTSWDNVMIKFPVRGIKMSKSWSNVTLSITDWLGRESEWFQYYAFQDTGDINANILETVATKPFYLWTYLWYNNSNVLKSWSWQTPTGNLRVGYSIDYAKANWTWYSIMWYYQRMYVNALYIMKYGNPNIKTVIWPGYTWNSDGKVATWWTNSQTNATYWTTSNTSQIKLFWLEDRRGNAFEWLWWTFMKDSYLYVALRDFVANPSPTQTRYKQTGFIWQTSSSYNLATIHWNNKNMFLPWTQVRNNNYNTYYCSYTARNSSGTYIGCCSSYYFDSKKAGIFNLFFTMSSSEYSWEICARLMYL